MPKQSVDQMTNSTSNRYQALVERLFFKHYAPGKTQFQFSREELVEAARALRIPLPKNLGDVLYSFRYRNPLPNKVLRTQPAGQEWSIQGAGRAKYVFKLVPVNLIVPNSALVTIKIPDATPELIVANAKGDEQALLARVRYNRLIDTFLGVTAYSLQNHLRTTVKDHGQIEIDEIYAAVDRHGCQYIIPVQAKGGSDRLSTVQTKQDIDCCRQKFPHLVCRAVSAQFMSQSLIAMFELCIDGGEGMVKVVDEKHYQLVAAGDIDETDLINYRSRASARL